MTEHTRIKHIAQILARKYGFNGCYNTALNFSDGLECAYQMLRALCEQEYSPRTHALRTALKQAAGHSAQPGIDFAASADDRRLHAIEAKR